MEGAGDQNIMWERAEEENKWKGLEIKILCGRELRKKISGRGWRSKYYVGKS